MTFAEMQTEVSRRLAEVGGRVFWSSSDIREALNLGLAELSDASEWYEQVVDIDLLTDRPYYDLWAILGPDVLSVKPAFDRQTNRWLLASTVRQLDAHDRRWERVTGEPQRSWMHGLRWLGLYPRTQSDLGTIKQYYTALPPPMVADTDEPGFPDTFHMGCVEFAMTDLWAQDGETAYALAAFQLYLATEAALVAWVDGRAQPALQQGFSDSGVSVQR